jgi:S-adenosylmethionine decarboxylase
MLVGTEWIIDASGCDPAALRDVARLRALLDGVVAGLGLRVLGEPRWHAFEGEGGVTGMYLLAESHLTVHTYPEWAVATLNLYCCRARDPWDWDASLRAALGATAVVVRAVRRGA